LKFSEQQYSSFRHRVSKHQILGYARNLGGMAPLVLPNCAYGLTSVPMSDRVVRQAMDITAAPAHTTIVGPAICPALKRGSAIE